MELIQLLMLTKHASVIRKSNSLINLLLLPPRLSGRLHNLNHNQKASSRELLNTLLKLLRLPKKRNLQQKNQQLQLESKTTKLLLISKLPRSVLFNQLKKLTNLEKLKFNKRELLAQRPLQRREPLLTLCNSNLMLRRPQLSKLALTQTRKVFLIKLDFKLNAKE